MPMTTIERIVRSINRALSPQFEERLRTALAEQDREWLIDQIVRLTLDAHSLQEIDVQGVVADVSLLTRSVHHVTTFTPNTFGVKPPDTLSTPTGRSVVSGDAARLFFTTGWDVWTYDARAGKVDGPTLVNAPVADLAVSGDSRRLYVATAKDPALPLNEPVLVFESVSGEPLAFPRAATSMNGH